jgi:hypothetical protein
LAARLPAELALLIGIFRRRSLLRAPPTASVKYVEYSPSSFVAVGAPTTRRLGPNFNQ